MKPNFNPKEGDVVRIRHHILGVVDAEYLFPSLLNKNHIVKVFNGGCRAQNLKPRSGKIFDKVRFVYPVECMPDYRKQEAKL